MAKYSFRKCPKCDCLNPLAFDKCISCRFPLDDAEQVELDSADFDRHINPRHWRRPSLDEIELDRRNEK